MSLYGALYSGVSGLKAQGNKIGIISDNIANVNTVGYKAGSAQFETLVTNSALATSYTPGGVLGGNRQLVDKQGLLITTDAPTDIAISGGGFFSVNAKVDGSDLPLYTRAGSFRQDNLGNFVNAAGFYLQGWPLDREGRLPGEVGNLNTISSANLDSLETVNVESSSGVASATTTVEIGANLDAGESIFKGSGRTVDMDPLSTNNHGIQADDIIVPAVINAGPPVSNGPATTNSLVRGDAMEVTTGSGLTYTYTYGGFAAGRDVTTVGAASNGDGGVNQAQTVGVNFASTIGSNIVTVTHAGHAFGPVGSTRTINIGSMLLADLGGAFAAPGLVTGDRTITITGANSYTYVADANALATVAAFGNAATTVDDFTGNILDATTASQAFLINNSLSQFTTAARSFTITSSTAGTVTFTYTSTSPNATLGQFNSLNNLATAIDSVAGLTARVSGGRLFVSADDANEALTFANGDATGAGTLGGINWISELDLANVAAGTNRFNTQQGLANLVNNSNGLSAVTSNALSNATTEIYNDDPLDTIRFEDFLGTAVALPNNPVDTLAGGPAGSVTIRISDPGHSYVVGQNVVLAGLTATGGLTAAELTGSFPITAVAAGTYDITVTAAGVVAAAAVGGGAAGTAAATNQGSLLAELGIVNSLNGGTYVRGDTGVINPAYDSSGTNGGNMAGEDIVAQFSRNSRIYDALGAGHDLRFSFIKIATNSWAVEVHAVPATDVSTTLVDGQVAVGTITFNGDGSLRSVSSGLSNPVTISWTNGAVASEVAFDWGTAGEPFGTTGATAIGLTDGLSQFDSNYNVAFVNQNGSPVGELISVDIDRDGYVIANYSNGENQRLYKLPIADFNNPNALKTITGNVFAQTRDSGEVNLREAGENGVGTVESGALESSNVELAEQLTDMIVAQRAYQSNTRVISTTDDLLEQLNQL